MTNHHIDHDGDNYRIEISDAQCARLQQGDDGAWNIGAQMRVKAADVLAALPPAAIR